MIIKCDHCSARFRMDDSKLANGPVKVRCSKCKEVFVVKKEDPAAENVVTAKSEESAPSSENVSSRQFEPVPASGDSSDADGFSFDVPAKPEDSFTQDSAELSFDVDSPSVKKETVSEQADSSDDFDWQVGTSESDALEKNSDFDLSSFESSLVAPPTAEATATSSDDNDFDFGEITLQADSAPAVVIPPVSDNAQPDDFSMDFGEISFSDQASNPQTASAVTTGFSDEPDVAPPDSSAQPAETSDSDDFNLSFNSDAVQKALPPSAEAEVSENVNFGEFNFGDMDDSAVTESSKPAVSPVNLNPGDSATADFSQEYPEEELPPSSLTSRKKSGSTFPLLVILGAILLIIALAGSGVYFFGGPKAFSKVGLGFLVEWYGDKGGEDGSIALKGVTAAYIVNTTAGELFVVRGEAVNNFKKPRASIQIKVSLLGAGGAPIVTKSAFCGNSLSNDQLTALPLAKIEETLNNQFGDSLANLGLKPGVAIPFVVVVSPIPKDASDYTVQVGGSTVATQ